jgi:hypothetical protein
MFARRRVRLLLPLAPLVLVASCSRPVDLKQALEVTDTSSGWYDAGIVEGKNKIVPSVTFRLRKNMDVNLDGVALNVVFRQSPAPGTSTEEDWDEVYIQNAQFTDGSQTAPLVVRPKAGYTGDPPQTRLEILSHSQFRDVRAHVFAKHRSSQWIELGTIAVQRQLLRK